MKKTEANDLPQRLTIDIGDLVERKTVGIPRDRLALDEEEREIDAILAFARSGRVSVGQSGRGESAAAETGLKGLAFAKGDVKLPKITHRVLVLLSLERRPEGASVAYMVAWAALVKVLEDDVARTSISPLLKKMSDPKRNKDEVRHDLEAHRWKITEAGEKVAAAFREQWLAAGQAPFWEVDVDDRKDAE
jgi:hypothetical protein